MSEDLPDLAEVVRKDLRPGAVFISHVFPPRVSKVRLAIAEQAKRLSTTAESIAHRLRNGGRPGTESALEELRTAGRQVQTLIELVAALQDDEREADKLGKDGG